MMLWKRLWVAAVLAAAMTSLVLSRAVASGVDPDSGGSANEQAKQHFARGVSSYKGGDLEAALAEFNKAYETRADYRVLYNIGQVQAERHDNAAALKALRQYLADGGSNIDAPRRAAVDQTLADLAQRVGTVMVTADGEGGEVLVDGVSAAKLPLGEPLTINAGVREITVRSGAQLAAPRRINVAGGDALRLAFQVGARPAESPLLPYGDGDSTKAAGPPGGSSIKPRVWIAYATAAALAASATTFAILARRADQDLDTDLGQFPGNRTTIDHDRSRLKTWAGLTDGFAAAAVLAAGVGTYYLLSGPSAGESRRPLAPSAQVSLLPFSSGATFSLTSTF